MPDGRAFAAVVGEGHGPPANLAAAQGPPGRCEHRPLQRFVASPGSHFPGWPRALPPFVGADSISARGAFAPPQTGPIWNRPLQGVCSDAWPRPSRLAQSAKFIRRGGIYPARRRVSEANRRAAAALRPEIPPVEPCAAVGSPGRYGIGPYRRQGNAHSRPQAFAAPQACGTMRTSSPTVSTAFSFAAPPGCWRRGGVQRDEGIPPYGRPGGRSHSGWPDTQKYS